MTLKSFGESLLNRVDPRVIAVAERALKAIPYVRGRIEKEFGGMLSGIEHGLRPYAGKVASYAQLPVTGRARAEVLQEMERLADLESPRWQEGFLSGAVYNGDPEHIEFMNKVCALNSQVNPLHSDVWPSASKYEAEIVSMVASMLGATSNNAELGRDEQLCGAVSSGGTESILLAMKTYRDRARARGNHSPEMVVPTTAHAAFDKASQYFGIKLVKVPVGEDFKADVKAMKAALSRRTIVVVASAPCFPYGLVDPVAELAAIAKERDIGCHVDACLGGFVLPWARRLGAPVPVFDFTVPGVTSMSVDTHKYGYAAKGTSVVLYRGQTLRSFQFYALTDWPGGLYFSPTLTGSRPGALSAAAWAALVSMGESGYLEATKRILASTEQMKAGVRALPELQLIGDAPFMVAFNSSSLDVYRVLDEMGKKGWNLNGLHRPAAVHLCVTLRHTQAGVAERFVADLQAAVAQVKLEPKSKGGMAPVYGMAGTIPLTGLVGDFLKRYLDLLYKV
jgi:glutamate/tyrosine decarboxylase-like PLP-dependent enzyme